MKDDDQSVTPAQRQYLRVFDRYIHGPLHDRDDMALGSLKSVLLADLLADAHRRSLPSVPAPRSAASRRRGLGWSA
jgi:hypothetical protein